MTSPIVGLLVIVGLWLCLALFCCSGRAFEKPLSPGERAEAERGRQMGCDTAERLKAAGAFTKIESGYSGVTHAYVGPAFFSIPVDAKESAIKAVALCHVDVNKRNQLGSVIIHDGYSGKRIGTFDFASGLDLD